MPESERIDQRIDDFGVRDRFECSGRFRKWQMAEFVS